MKQAQQDVLVFTVPPIQPNCLEVSKVQCRLRARRAFASADIVPIPKRLPVLADDCARHIPQTPERNGRRPDPSASLRFRQKITKDQQQLLAIFAAKGRWQQSQQQLETPERDPHDKGLQIHDTPSAPSRF
jgi:hypothetical protein